MIESHQRLIFSIINGLFCISLALFAFFRNPKNRLNRSFAYLNFSIAFLLVSGVAHILVFFNFLSHDEGLILYRALYQIPSLMVLYTLLIFVQELIGIHHRPRSIIVRRALGFLILATVPLIFTPYLFEDFIQKPLDHSPFTEFVGPLYPFFQAAMSIGLLSIGGFVFYHLKNSTGVLKNQLKFLIFALLIGMGATAAKYYSVNVRDVSWLTFLFQLSSTFVLSYIIFKYRLFEFNFWMRRMAISTGVYTVLLSFPFFLFVLKDSIPSQLQSTWWFYPSLAILYAGLFSLAPLLTSYIRDKAEQKRWSQLNEQLDFIRKTSEKLAGESNSTIQDVTDRAMGLLKEFYWNKLKNSPSFILMSVTDKAHALLTASVPALNIEETVLQEFLQCLQETKPLITGQAFSPFDVEKRLMEAQYVNAKNLTTIKKYLLSNKIELCCPCVHDGVLHGTFLLGSKQKDIFWPEEITTLEMAASHVATAVQKIGLIERTQSLHELDNLKKELISNITHEFKSPLANVENAIRILKKDSLNGSLAPEKVQKYLAMIQKNSERLTEFIENLLEVAKIEQPDVELKIKKTNLKPLVEDVIGHTRETALNKGVRIYLKETPSVFVMADANRLRQVVTNLIINAVKFTDQGEVAVQIKEENHKVRMQVIDTGCGIDPSHLKNIFDRFYQIAGSNGHNSKGTGLGLAIAKGWTEAHGGKIWAESDGVGRGATFNVELPIDDDEFVKTFHRSSPI